MGRATRDLQSGGPDWVWPDLIPLGWFVFVLAAYWLLTEFAPPPGQPAAAVTGLAELDRGALPLMAASGAAAIIRYFVCRPLEETGLASRPGAGERDVQQL